MFEVKLRISVERVEKFEDEPSAMRFVRNNLYQIGVYEKATYRNTNIWMGQDGNIFMQKVVQ